MQGSGWRHAHGPHPNHYTVCALDAHGVGPPLCTVPANGIADCHLAFLDMAPDLPSKDIMYNLQGNTATSNMELGLEGPAGVG